MQSSLWSWFLVSFDVSCPYHCDAPFYVHSIWVVLGLCWKLPVAVVSTIFRRISLSSHDDGTAHATDVLIVGMRASVCGYGEVRAFALRGSGPRVLFVKGWPVRSPSWMDGTKTSVEESPDTVRGTALVAQCKDGFPYVLLQL